MIMLKVISLFLVSVFILGFAGCDSDTSPVNTCKKSELPKDLSVQKPSQDDLLIYSYNILKLNWEDKGIYTRKWRSNKNEKNNEENNSQLDREEEPECEYCDRKIWVSQALCLHNEIPGVEPRNVITDKKYNKGVLQKTYGSVGSVVDDQKCEGNKPDIIGLQEVLGSQLKDFKEIVKDEQTKDNSHSYCLISGKNRGSNDEFNPIIINEKRFSLIDNGTFWLYSDESVLGPTYKSRFKKAAYKIANWVLLIDKSALLPYPFYVVNTHIFYKDPILRQKQIQVIAYTLADEKRFNSNYPVIITGDFNERSISPGMDFILNQKKQKLRKIKKPPGTSFPKYGYKDSLCHTENNIQFQTCNHSSFNNEIYSDVYSDVTKPENSISVLQSTQVVENKTRIDYILTSPNIKIVETIIKEYQRKFPKSEINDSKKLGYFSSDHALLGTRIKFLPKDTPLQSDLFALKSNSINDNTGLSNANPQTLEVSSKAAHCQSFSRVDPRDELEPVTCDGDQYKNGHLIIQLNTLSIGYENKIHLTDHFSKTMHTVNEICEKLVEDFSLESDRRQVEPSEYFKSNVIWQRTKEQLSNNKNTKLKFFIGNNLEQLTCKNSEVDGTYKRLLRYLLELTEN